MPTLAERYRGPADLPQRIPVFPLRGAILLPRAGLPLNVFEPRYLELIDDVMSGGRLLGIVQPASADEESPAGKGVALRRVGCVGRITHTAHGCADSLVQIVSKSSENWSASARHPRITIRCSECRAVASVVMLAVPVKTVADSGWITYF